MGDRLGELQDALIPALKADAVLGQTFPDGRPRVFDKPPTNQTFPYLTVSIGLDEAQPWECFDSGDVVSEFHVWDRSDPPGTRRAKRIAAAAVNAVTAEALGPLPNHTVGEIVPLDTRVLEDPDGQTVHVVSRIKIALDAA